MFVLFIDRLLVHTGMTSNTQVHINKCNDGFCTASSMSKGTRQLGETLPLWLQSDFIKKGSFFFLSTNPVNTNGSWWLCNRDSLLSAAETVSDKYLLFVWWILHWAAVYREWNHTFEILNRSGWARRLKTESLRQQRKTFLT